MYIIICVCVRVCIWSLSLASEGGQEGGPGVRDGLGEDSSRWLAARAFLWREIRPANECDGQTWAPVVDTAAPPPPNPRCSK